MLSLPASNDSRPCCLCVFSFLGRNRGGNGGNVHVPYRNSVMTSILRDSLGGNCRTTFIVTLNAEVRFSPSMHSLESGILANDVVVVSGDHCHCPVLCCSWNRDTLRNDSPKTPEKPLAEWLVNIISGIMSWVAEYGLQLTSCVCRWVTWRRPSRRAASPSAVRSSRATCWPTRRSTPRSWYVSKSHIPVGAGVDDRALMTREQRNFAPEDLPHVVEV